MMEKEMCRACFEIDHHNRSFWEDHSVDTKQICHFLHPEKANGWEPLHESNDYWKDYKNLQAEGTTRLKNEALNTFMNSLSNTS
jgi:hypothetical protein